MTGPCRIGRESRKSTGPLFLTSAVGVQGGFVRALYCLQGRCSEDSSQELVDRTLPLDDGCQQAPTMTASTNAANTTGTFRRVNGAAPHQW